MYHTPNLTGLRKKVIPKRINEGWGLQHMKLYGVDDEIVLSGCELLATSHRIRLKANIPGTMQSKSVARLLYEPPGQIPCICLKGDH
jgi:hypothetical protein